MKDDLRRSLDLIEAGNFSVGENWEEAHMIAQNHEGEAEYDIIYSSFVDFHNSSFNYIAIGFI